MIRPVVESKAIEGDALSADWDLRQLRADLSVESITVHAEIRGRVSQSPAGVVARTCSDARSIVSAESCRWPDHSSAQIHRGDLLTLVAQLTTHREPRQLVAVSSFWGENGFARPARGRALEPGNLSEPSLRVLVPKTVELLKSRPVSLILIALELLPVGRFRGKQGAASSDHSDFPE